MAHERHRIKTFQTLMSLVISGAIFVGTLSSCSTIADPGEANYDNVLRFYYTEPGRDAATAKDKRIDKFLVQFLDQAEKSIDAALYGLDRNSVIEALIRAHRRGVKVRFVGEESKANSSGYQRLKESGVPMSLGNKNGIMHHKFFIIDDNYLFSGTGNITDNGFLRNNNHFYLIENPALVKSYQKEFESLFVGNFGSDKESPSRYRFEVNGIVVENYFSPQQGQRAVERIIQLIDSANKSIYFMIFAFTHDEISSALIRASKRGVTVRGVIDSTFIKGVSETGPRLYAAYKDPYAPCPQVDSSSCRDRLDLRLRRDGNENYIRYGEQLHGGKLHTKTMLIDAGEADAKLITGSLNWSHSAVHHNDENIMIFHSPEAVQVILPQWEKVYALSGSGEFAGLDKAGDAIGESLQSIQGHGFDHSCARDYLRQKDVVISEIHWAGSKSTSGYSGKDVMVELHNRTNCAVDISHWSLSWFDKTGQERNWPVPSNLNAYHAPGSNEMTNNIIEPKGYLVIFHKNNKAFDSRYCLGSNSGGNTSGPCAKIYQEKIDLGYCRDKGNYLVCYDNLRYSTEIPRSWCRFDQYDRCHISKSNYCSLSQGRIYLPKCQASIGRARISASKDFALDQHNFFLLLYDKKMSPMDTVGDKGRVFAGGSITMGNEVIYQSMERRPLLTRLPDAAYFATGARKGMLRPGELPRDWDGQAKDNWCSAQESGDYLAMQIEDGSIYDYGLAESPYRIHASPLQAGSCGP